MPRLTTLPRASRKVAIASLICAWPVSTAWETASCLAIDFYSLRNATIGSTRLARRAGIQQANIVAANMSKPTPR